MYDRKTLLADLHLYGGIRAEDFLEYVTLRDVDWTPFETTYRQVFGGISSIPRLANESASQEGVT